MSIAARRSSRDADGVLACNRGSGARLRLFDRLQRTLEEFDEFALALLFIAVVHLERVLGKVVELGLNLFVERAADEFPLAVDQRSQQRDAQLRGVAALEDEIGDDL